MYLYLYSKPLNVQLKIHDVLEVNYIKDLAARRPAPSVAAGRAPDDQQQQQHHHHHLTVVALPTIIMLMIGSIDMPTIITGVNSNPTKQLSALVKEPCKGGNELSRKGAVSAIVDIQSFEITVSLIPKR